MHTAKRAYAFFFGAVTLVIALGRLDQTLLYFRQRYGRRPREDKERSRLVVVDRS